MNPISCRECPFAIQDSIYKGWHCDYKAFDDSVSVLLPSVNGLPPDYRPIHCAYNNLTNNRGRTNGKE